MDIVFGQHFLDVQLEVVDGDTVEGELAVVAHDNELHRRRLVYDRSTRVLNKHAHRQ